MEGRRTDGRSDYNVIAKTKFLASMGYHIFLTMVLRYDGPPRRTKGPIYGRAVCHSQIAFCIGKLTYQRSARKEALNYIQARFQTSLQSCVEPNCWVKHGRRAALESTSFVGLGLERQTTLSSGNSVALCDHGATVATYGVQVMCRTKRIN